MMNKTTKKPFNFFATVIALILALSLLVAVVPSSLLATSDIAAVATYTDTTAPGSDGSGASSGDGSGNTTDTPGGGVIDPTNPTNAGDSPIPPSSGSATVINASLPTITADTTRPQIFALTPTDTSITGPSVDISMDYSDSESGIFTSYTMPMLHVDNVHQECGIGNPNSCTITSSRMSTHKSGLSDGSHTLQGFVRDNASPANYASATWHIIVDATPPVISSAQPTGRINSSSTSITASFDDLAGTGFNSAPSGVDPASATATIDGENVSCTVISATGISCPVSGLSTGSHSAQVEVSDLVGNRATYPWNFEIDTAAIGVSGQTPADQSWLTVSSPIVAAALQAAGTGIIDTGSITMLLDSDDVSSMTNRQSEGVTYSPLHLDEGWHSVVLTAHDDAGHEGHSEWSFAIDTISPQIQDAQPTGTTTAQPIISVAFSDGGSGIDTRSINLILDGENRSDAATVTGEGVTFALPERLSSGSHNVQLSIADQAGNEQTSAWSFTVPQTQATSDPVTNPASRQINVFAYWLEDSLILGGNSGSWTISGFPAFPNLYYLPWYDSGPASAGISDEIAISNNGAGEASVNVFVGSENKWQGKVAEGATEICRMPGAVGGPVKIICPTGQPLSVTHRLARGGMVSESQAVPEETMDSVLLLPWFEAPADGNSAIIIANAGNQDAAVDVYVGDPMLPESLRGHYSIGPSAAMQAELPETAGGPVRIVSTSNQPLVAELRTINDNSVAVLPATGLSQLQGRYQLTAPGATAGNRISGIYLGNGNDRDLTVEIRVDNQQVRDAENSDSDFFTITGESTRAIDIPELNGKQVEVVCTNCSLGEGFVAGWKSL